MADKVSKAAEKASRYISSLYEARCNDRWQDVPELARKVEKHAAGRECLTLAARADALVHTRPTREAFEEADKRYGEPLSKAYRDTRDVADALDATTTLAAIDFGRKEYDAALMHVPEPLHRIQVPTRGVGRDAWRTVCILQGTLIRGLCFEALGNEAGATDTYRSIISYLSSTVALDTPCPAVRRAAEELTTHVCLYFSTGTNDKSESMGEAMAAYHVLSRLLNNQSGKFISSRGTFTRNTPRQFWRVYYTALSRVIKEGLVYHPSPLDRDHEALEHKGLLDDADFVAARKQQRAELRRVEQKYETILLHETSFPKANEVNEEVKSWVEMVMSNWRVLCGPNWTDEELGEGGKSAVGRNTLDVLYRAQTKTFHSTQVLRHLFTINAYLADFDLALKAFDTYVEILTKGKARAKKTGSAGLDLDDDDTAMRLASDAVRLACRYGSENAAEKALYMGMMIQQWLEHGTPDTPLPAAMPTVGNLAAEGEPSPDATFSEGALELGYQSIGISQATWSRHTFDPNMREALQEKAVQNLRTSLRYRTGGIESSATLYALSMILAELGRPDEALVVARYELEPTFAGNGSARPSVDNTVNGSTDASPTGSSDLDAIGTMPMRHLYSLLLCAAEDYDGSSAACTAALDEATGSGKSGEHEGSLKNAVGSMSGHDRQNAVELKMTQISLLGISEGIEKAVNASNELIALYSQLFGPVNTRRPQRAMQQQQQQIPPKSSSGTIKSIFGRSKRNRKSAYAGTASTSQYTSAAPSTTHTALPSRPATMATAPPPAINVIDESDGATTDTANHSAVTSGDSAQMSEKQTTPKRGGSLRNKGHGSIKSKRSSARPTINLENEKASAEMAGTNPSLSKEDGTALSGVQSGGDQPLDPVPHNPHHTKTSRPVAHDDQPPKQDTRLPVPHPKADYHTPAPQFLQLQASRFKISLLVKVWLFIAELYTESSLHADAAEAVDEAFSLVEILELEVSQEESSLKHFQERGWGGGKSVEDLWGGVCAARGILLAAQNRPHDALHVLEQSLTHSLNHPRAIVALSTNLLDIYTQKIPSEKPDPDTLSLSSMSSSRSTILTSALSPTTTIAPLLPKPKFNTQRQDESPSQTQPGKTPQKSFTEQTLSLYRLAARDRAYALLSSLVRTYAGHALPEAWLVLARAYELSGQVEEAKGALWRVVELEDTRGVRGWGDALGVGGFVLR